MRKTTILKGLAILLAFMTVLTACSSKKSEANALLSKFESSCNSLDLNGMLDCIDPAVSDKIKLVTGIAGMFTDNDTDEILEGISNLFLQGQNINAKDFFSSIKIEPENVNTEDGITKASAVVKYSLSGEDYENNAVFTLIQDEDSWYISDIDFN